MSGLLKPTSHIIIYTHEDTGTKQKQTICVYGSIFAQVVSLYMAANIAVHRTEYSDIFDAEYESLFDHLGNGQSMKPKSMLISLRGLDTHRCESCSPDSQTDQAEPSRLSWAIGVQSSEPKTWQSS